MWLPQPRRDPRPAWLQVPALGHAASFPPWGGRGGGAEGGGVDAPADPRALRLPSAWLPPSSPGSRRGLPQGGWTR